MTDADGRCATAPEEGRECLRPPLTALWCEVLCLGAGAVLPPPGVAGVVGVAVLPPAGVVAAEVEV